MSRKARAAAGRIEVDTSKKVDALRSRWGVYLDTVLLITMHAEERSVWTHLWKRYLSMMVPVGTIRALC